MPVNNPLSDAQRLARLKAHLQQGGSRYSFARQEGIRLQSLLNWLDRRPDYERQLAGYDRGHKSAPVTGPQYWQRVEAIRRRKADRLAWKVVAYPLGITDKALRQWYYINRAAVDAALGERRAA